MPNYGASVKKQKENLKFDGNGKYTLIICTGMHFKSLASLHFWVGEKVTLFLCLLGKEPLIKDIVDLTILDQEVQFFFLLSQIIESL